MKKLLPILMIIGLSTTSCADWLGGEDVTLQPDAVTLSQHHLIMLVGDTCRLSAAFSPEDFLEQSLLWTSSVDSIVNIDANTLVAKNVGESNIIITSAIGLLTDTCRVEVQEAWGDVKTDYYDMVMYAALDPALDPEDVEIGAFYNNELRGRGVQRTAHGVTFTSIRVYSPMISNDSFLVPITFRCHLRKEGRVVLFPDTIYFDGETHGSLSDLYPLNLN